MPLTLAIGELDADLTAIAALSPSNDDVIQRKTGAWTNRTMTQVATDLLATGGFLRKATVTLSSADILALHTTPVTLVAAPGATSWLCVHRVLWFYSHGSAQYATTAAAFPYLGYGANPSVGGADIVSDPDDIVKVGDLDLPGSIATDLVNQPLKVQNDGAGQTFTDGDGTLTVTVWYSVEDVPA